MDRFIMIVWALGISYLITVFTIVKLMENGIFFRWWDKFMGDKE